MELNPSKGTIIVNDESVHLSTSPLVLETENNQLFARVFKTEDDFIVVELQPFGMTVKLNPLEIVILVRWNFLIFVSKKILILELKMCAH